MKNIEKYLQFGLALAIIVGFFVAVVIFMTTAIPSENVGSVNLLIGALIAAFTSLVSYFWGSSQGSKNKDATINNALNPTTNTEVKDA